VNHLNRLLDRVRPVGSVFDRPISMFRLWGYAGYSLAVLLAMILAYSTDLSLGVMAGAALVAASAFFGLAAATKIVTGEEYLVYYHHEIAVVSLTALYLWLLGQPVLPYLDLTILGVGAFLICGRIGCLMVGCCHGRPHAWGVCYGEEHARAGFARYLVGVRLFPIQGVESLYVSLVVLAGIWLVASGRPAGTALAWYVVAYDLGRFSFEFMRGDAERPYAGGFSAAQWISLVLTVGVASAEWAGVLPFQAWHSAAAGALVLAMIGVTLYRWRRKPAIHLLLRPGHVRELALLLNGSGAEAARAPVAVGETSLGVRISSGTIDDPAGEIRQFTFSLPDSADSLKAAHVLARLVMQLRHLTGDSQLVTGRQSAYHLLVRMERGE